MELNELLSLFDQHPGVLRLRECLSAHRPHVRMEGLRGSAPAVVLGAVGQSAGEVFLVVADDEEEAAYFYNDLRQLLGERDVLFLPSSYRRAVKYGHRDTASEILRTDVLSRLSAEGAAVSEQALFIVTFPTALAERVPPRRSLTERSITLKMGETHDVIELTRRLEELGFKRKDYVYEPGEYALRGSILDIFSFSSEYPYRIDFFGDEVESVNSFEVQTQLSRAVVAEAVIVPNVEVEEKGELLVPFTDYLPERPIVVAHDLRFVCDRVQQIFDEGFAEQALAEQAATSEMELSEVYARFAASRLLVSGKELQAQLEGSIFWQWVRGSGTKSTTGSEKVPTVVFHTQPQPLFHKNFEQVLDAFVENLANGKRTFVLADSEKQQERLRDILAELMQTTGKRAEGALFTPVHLTLHEGFSDSSVVPRLHRSSDLRPLPQIQFAFRPRAERKNVAHAQGNPPV